LLAQIVENHQTRLSSRSGGLVDMFDKVMTKTESLPVTLRSPSFWSQMTIFFSDLFSIIALWEARKTRRMILYNLREKSADDLIFWWSYGNCNPRLSYLSLGRVARSEVATQSQPWSQPSRLRSADGAFWGVLTRRYYRFALVWGGTPRPRSADAPPCCSARTWVTHGAMYCDLEKWPIKIFILSTDPANGLKQRASQLFVISNKHIVSY
jgi:hypothetical protein